MQVIKAFQRDRPGAILLMSTRSAAISTVMGIEVAASHVFITEPSLSPALEERALACACSLDQCRPITVHWLFVEVGHRSRECQVRSTTAHRATLVYLIL